MIGVGVNAWVWTSPFTADSVELIARAQAMGFDAITIPVEEPSAIDGPAVREVASELVYVDASESDRGAPGSGQVDWAGLARALREIGYAGDCVIESFTPECQAIAAAAAIWRPLAPSQDALARDGHAFLRRLLAR